MVDKEPTPQSSRSDEITRILNRANDTLSAAQSAAELLPLVYDELRELAHARMQWERPDLTLQATALVHEAYLRLMGDTDPGWGGRAHFFGAAARAMRRILIEQGRRRGRLKHGGQRQRVSIDEVEIASDSDLEGEIAVA